MATDPLKSLAPKSMPAAANNGLPSLSESDLADLSLRELLGVLLSSVGVAERKAYLERLLQDKPNGFYDRSLQLGTMPLDVRVPRTRSGDFRPASLPPLYQRGYSDETQTLLLSLLSSGRSLNAVKDALQKMGLSSSQQELEAVAAGLIEELDLRNRRPLDPDLLVLFLDGKYVEFRDQDRLRPACIYVVVGLRRDGRKQVLTCLPRPGRENLEDWKFVLRSLLERGLRRVLLLVQDDFFGLLPITQSWFTNTDVQLCTVHMQRNAKTHLSKADATEFQQRWRAIKSSWNLEVANQQFEQLCDRFAKNSPAFVVHIVPYFEKMLLPRIKPSHIVEFHTAMEAKKVGKKTRRNLHAILTKMFTYAHDLELIPSNPVKKGIAPKQDKIEKPALTEEQLYALFDAVPIRHKAFYMTLAFTGIRTGEALGLKWADVDFASHQLNIRRAIYRGGETTPKTSGSIRPRPMVDELYTALLNHKAMSAFTRPEDYVFASSSGRPMNPDTLREVLQSALEKLEIKFDQPRADGMHLLRHTSGSLVYRRTADVKLAQEWLGHSSPRITLDRYVHLMKDAQNLTAQAVFARPIAVPREQQN